MAKKPRAKSASGSTALTFGALFEGELLAGSYGEFTKSGDVMMRNVAEKVWGDVNKKYGTDAKLPPAE